MTEPGDSPPRRAAQRATRRAAPASSPLVALIVAAVVALVLLGIGSVHAPPSTSAARISHLESVIKCPSCESLSIGQSDTPVARRLDAIVAAEVRAGESDAAIEAQVLAEYPGSVLVPGGGLGLALVLIPTGAIVLGAALLGAFLLRRRRRSPLVAGEGDEEDEELLRRARAEEARDGG